MTGTGERENLICVGAITTAHGVRGLVKVKSFTRNAADFAAFGELSDASATRSFKAEIVGKNKDLFLVKIDGVTDRNAAEALSSHRKEPCTLSCTHSAKTVISVKKKLRFIFVRPVCIIISSPSEKNT